MQQFRHIVSWPENWKDHSPIVHIRPTFFFLFSDIPITARTTEKHCSKVCAFNIQVRCNRSLWHRTKWLLYKLTEHLQWQGMWLGLHSTALQLPEICQVAHKLHQQSTGKLNVIQLCKANDENQNPQLRHLSNDAKIIWELTTRVETSHVRSRLSIYDLIPCHHHCKCFCPTWTTSHPYCQIPQSVCPLSLGPFFHTPQMLLKTIVMYNSREQYFAIDVTFSSNDHLWIFIHISSNIYEETWCIARKQKKLKLAYMNAYIPAW